MLTTEALAADKESKTVGEMSGVLATMEWRSSTISGSTEHSCDKIHDNLADSFRWGRNLVIRRNHYCFVKTIKEENI